ncbi:MAG TPA: hypothetical protein VFS19_05005 [Planctomycetota bacterium]|nr:hypothetical protein [Planctomycetota bacterium]
MKSAATAAVLLALAGCVSPPESGPRNRKLTYGLFYDVFRPDSSRRQELARKLDRPAAPEIDESYDVSKIRAVRQYSEVPDDYDLRDWKDGVLARADAGMLRRMRDDTAAKVGTLEGRLASLNREPPSISRGRIEPVRQQLDVEKMKLVEIDNRLARAE